VLAAATATLATPLIGRASAADLAPMPSIVPRAQWGPRLLPTGAMEAEEVRFLIVHHTYSPGSDYTLDEVPGLLADMYEYHTGPSKGWPDLAYNFLVDKFGTIYEGRSGSLAGPIAGSATGGNQGFTQLCCFIGDYSSAPPPPEALESMLHLLAWLADRYAVDTRPGATVEFMSRGSNRWPAGTPVTTPTICGHRDMSQTECPGDGIYPLVRDRFQQLVTALRPGMAEPKSALTTVPDTVPATTASSRADGASSTDSAEGPGRSGPASSTGWLGVAAIAAGLTALGAILRLRRRPRRMDGRPITNVDPEDADGAQLRLRTTTALADLGKESDDLTHRRPHR
jgi:hypothetical protein